MKFVKVYEYGDIRIDLVISSLYFYIVVEWGGCRGFFFFVKLDIIYYRG